jgi:hypothetical protein
VRVAAPSGGSFSAACDLDLQRSALIRAIFTARVKLLRSAPDVSNRPRALVAWAKTLGWGVLAELPGREIVMGAVTRPWDANVVFREVSPEQFALFNEPDYVKIAGRCAPIPRATGRPSLGQRRAQSPPIQWLATSSAGTGRSFRQGSS